MTDTKQGLLALTLIVLVGFASLTGGTTLTVLSDAEQVTASINVELDYIEDNWNVEIRNVGNDETTSSDSTSSETIESGNVATKGTGNTATTAGNTPGQNTMSLLTQQVGKRHASVRRSRGGI